MGNLQTGESKPTKAGKAKTKIKLKGKKGKSDELLFTGVVPAPIEEKPHTKTAQDTNTEPTSNNVIVTDSWCKANNLDADADKKKPAASPSSSDSNFTDPLTPAGFQETHDSEESVHLEVEVPNTTQETFLHNLTLNSFKLNEYRARHEEEKCRKLSKLGVSRTSQISLDSDPSECFATDNVEIVSEGAADDSGVASDGLEREDTLKRRSGDSVDGTVDGRKVNEMVKRISDVSLTNGRARSVKYLGLVV